LSAFADLLCAHPISLDALAHAHDEQLHELAQARGGDLAALRQAAAPLLDQCLLAAADLLSSASAQAVLADPHARTAAALRHSEERLSLALAGADLGLWDWNVQTGETFYDERWLRMLGYESHELAPHYRTWESLVHPDDLPGVLAKLRLHLAGDEPEYEVEHRLRARDGSWRWILARGRVVERDASGRPLRAAGTHLDITARKLAEQKLRNSEQRYRAIVETQTELVCRCLPNTTLTFVNRAYARYFDTTPEQLVGRRFLDLVPPEEHERIRAYFRQFSPDRSILSHEHTVLTPRGERRWHLWTNRAIFDDVGKLVEFQAVGQDITERKRLEDELRLFLTVTDGAAHGVAIIDLDGRVTYANDAWAAMHGHAASNLVGRQIDVFHSAEQMPRVRALLDVLRRDGRFTAEEVWHCRADGTSFPTLMSAAVVQDSLGLPVRLAATAMDISAWREAEAEARQRRAELLHVARVATLGELATALSHTLSQPLAAIQFYARGSLRRLAARPLAGGELADVLEKIAVQAERAGDFVANVRRFARKEPAPRTRVDLNDLIRETLRLADVALQHAGVRAKLYLAQSLPPVRANCVDVQHVLLLLVQNAIDASRAAAVEDQLITIETRVQANALIAVAVRDRGHGLSDEALAHLFEPFFTTRPDGLGIGLSIARTITEAHGGTLSATRNPDRGATFTFTIPPAGDDDDRPT